MADHIPSFVLIKGKVYTSDQVTRKADGSLRRKPGEFEFNKQKENN